jgi:hypothetical protein
MAVTVTTPTTIIVKDSAARGPLNPDAYNQANTARTQANTAYGQANSAYGQANAAYNAANSISWVSVPASNTSVGTAGQAAYDSNGDLYICFSTNAWSKISGNTIW